MLENVILLFFSLLLLGSVFTGVPILAALFAGLLIFSGYARYQGFSLKEIVGMWAAGVKTIRNILMTFVIIGFLTGLWRAGGTIPTIVYYASGVIDPALIVLLTFVLNCLLSFLMGTSFGTAATMGLISMTIASTLGASKALVGGAVLSGIYFGDRCSPVSTSALLTADLTGTNLYDNIQRMMKSALVPFLLSLVFYGLMGGGEGTAETVSAVKHLFASHFDVSYAMLIPAASILVLAFFRVAVKKTLFVSVVLSFLCAYLYQGLSLPAILHVMFFGFTSPDPQLNAMLRGGGLLSMAGTTGIVMIGSCYSGIFNKTGLLRNIESVLLALTKRFFPFAGVFGAATISSLIGSNQTLAIIMTRDLSRKIMPDGKELALAIEDTAVVMSALVPWCIAGAVPLTFIGAPISSMLFAFYLYALPLWRLGKAALAEWQDA